MTTLRLSVTRRVLPGDNKETLAITGDPAFIWEELGVLLAQPIFHSATVTREDP